MNYFELFGLPVQPVVDKSTIQKKYFELQKKFHPDFFPHSTEMEKEEILQQSASINIAYKIFQDPYKTIAYFLETIGMITKDEKFELPPAFLMEMMDLNESLTEDPVAAAEEVSRYEQELWNEMQQIMDTYARGTSDGNDLQKLKASYYKKKYLDRILDRLGD